LAGGVIPVGFSILGWGGEETVDAPSISPAGEHLDRGAFRLANEKHL
jgi:hypothetical protein